MIIAFLGKNVYTYLNNCLYFLEQLTLLCPCCICKTTFHGQYKRQVREGDKKIWLIIYRVYCSNCEVTHAVIPDFIRPYKHYAACESELALRDSADGTPIEKIECAADISTVRRWIKEFKIRGERVATEIRSKISSQHIKAVNDHDNTDANLFHVLEWLLEKLPGIESSHLAIGESNQWLTKWGVGVFI